MYKNLSPSAIGVFGRQSELLEIALTHRFKGLEIDINEVLRRAQTSKCPAGLPVFVQCGDENWRV